VGALSDRLGRRSLLALAFAVFAVSYLGFSLTRNPVLIAGFFLLYGVFQGAFRAAGKALAVDLAPAGLRASGIGWYGTAVGLSGLLASLVAGLLWDRLGHAAVFAWGAAFAVLGLIALILFVPADHRARRAA
jgi:MFS family permease